MSSQSDAAFSIEPGLVGFALDLVELPDVVSDQLAGAWRFLLGIPELARNVRPATGEDDVVADLVRGGAITAVAIADQGATEGADLVGEQLAGASGCEAVDDCVDLRIDEGPQVGAEVGLAAPALAHHRRVVELQHDTAADHLQQVVGDRSQRFTSSQGPIVQRLLREPATISSEDLLLTVKGKVVYELLDQQPRQL